jgi:hypothetical protein
MNSPRSSVLVRLHLPLPVMFSFFSGAIVSLEEQDAQAAFPRASGR